MKSVDPDISIVCISEKGQCEQHPRKAAEGTTLLMASLV